MRVGVSFTPDEWTHAQLIAASRTWYQMGAWLRELVLREIARCGDAAADVLGDEVVVEARRLSLEQRTRRLAKVKREVLKLERAKDLCELAKLDELARFARLALRALEDPTAEPVVKKCTALLAELPRASE